MSRAPSHPEVEFLRPEGLRGVELRYSRYRTSAFRTHTHPVWSVGTITSGATTFTLGGRSYRATGGDMVVIAPGKAHACNPDPDVVMAYHMFYLAPEWLAPREPGMAFPVFRSPVIKDEALFAQWMSVWEALTAEGSAHGDASRTRSASGAKVSDGGLAEAVEVLIARHAVPGGRPMRASSLDAVETAKRALERDLAQRVTLEHLAHETGTSRSHLSRTFAAAVGLPPHTYQNQLRVERAKQMLAQGESPADISASLGFSDQAHFSRVFREFTGATPSQYQA